MLRNSTEFLVSRLTFFSCLYGAPSFACNEPAGSRQRVRSGENPILNTRKWTREIADRTLEHSPAVVRKKSIAVVPRYDGTWHHLRCLARSLRIPVDL